MKNFQEKEIKKLSEIIGGGIGHPEITKGLKYDRDGEITVAYDLTWVK